jgi:hypothetical protein
MKDNNFYVVAFSEEVHNPSEPEMHVSQVSYVEDPSSSNPVKVEQVVFEEKIPGSDALVNSADDHESVPEELPMDFVKDWKDNKNVKSFMKYVESMYPGGIPAHDGKSTLGCERAIRFLDGINKEISSAIKKDMEDVLDVVRLEEVRVSIMKDLIVLKDHLTKLKSGLKDMKKSASIEKEAFEGMEEDIEMVYDRMIENEAMEKKAFSPKLRVVVTPFERAISGILINSVVAGGKPFEEVFEFLKKKYDLNERDELSIMQVVMDSGFPIFKDRGTFSQDSSKSKEENYGIEFIKNYFS